MQAVYDAVSNCSNLHPDLNEDGDVDMGSDDKIQFEGSIGYASGLSGVQAGVSVYDFVCLDMTHWEVLTNT